MNHRRNSYQKYKDDRDVLTRKLMNKVGYVFLNEEKKLVKNPDGFTIFFYKYRAAVSYLLNNNTEQWKIKKVRLDITTL